MSIKLRLVAVGFHSFTSASTVSDRRQCLSIGSHHLGLPLQYSTDSKSLSIQRTLTPIGLHNFRIASAVFDGPDSQFDAICIASTRYHPYLDITSIAPDRLKVTSLEFHKFETTTTSSYRLRLASVAFHDFRVAPIRIDELPQPSLSSSTPSNRL